MREVRGYTGTRHIEEKWSCEIIEGFNRARHLVGGVHG